MTYCVLRPISCFVLLCLLGISLLLTSCGSGSSTASSSTESMTLKVVQNSGAIGYFPLYIAQQQHLFAKEGLALDPAVIPLMGTGPKTTAAIESGSVDLAAGVITDPLKLAREDASIQLVGGITADLSTDIVVSKRFAELHHLSASSPLADKVRALVGKHIGVTGVGAATEAFLIYLFRLQGLDARKETVINYFNVSDTAVGLAALRTERVDAISYPAPTGLLAEREGIGERLIRSSEIAALRGVTNCVLYAKKGVLESKPKAVQAFIRAIAGAELFIRQHPEQAKIELSRYLSQNPKTQQDQPTVDAIFETMAPSFAASPRIDPKGFEAAAAFHVKGGLLAIIPRYSSIVATHTIDTALAGNAHS
jgi:NitT/TauT family transport system substrate-binding protein